VTCLVWQAVVSDVPSCGGVQYAQQQGITTLTYPASKKGLFPGLTPEELVQQLTQQLGAEYVILAGYLKVKGRRRAAIAES
jgi:phosphoribosylglycinamide formyltransferase